MINQQNLVAVLAMIAQSAVEQIRKSLKIINEDPEALALCGEESAKHYRTEIKSIRSDPRVAEATDSWKEIPFCVRESMEQDALELMKVQVLRMLGPIGLAGHLPIGPIEWREGAGSRALVAMGVEGAAVLSLSDMASGIKVEVYAKQAKPDPRGGEAVTCALCYHVVRANSSPA